MSFHPPLFTTTFVPLPSSSSNTAPSSSPCVLHFTYLPSPPSSHAANATPEVWTDLPFDGEGWHAIPLSPSHDSKLWTTSVDLSRVEVPKSFEYTYRLKHSDGREEWLGSTGSNGKVEVVAAPTKEEEGQTPGFGNVEGNWKTLGEGVSVGSLELKDGKSGDVQDFDLTRLLGGSEEGWLGGQGVVWEQSSRTWFVPSPLPAKNVLPSLSSTFPAQLLVLQSTTSAAHPVQHTLVLFPFSTSRVCSTLVGCEGGDKLLLRTERDLPSSSAVGNVAVAWGESGSLETLVASAVAAARCVLLDEPYSRPSALPSPVDVRKPPLPLGLCTWNALGPSYTLSGVLTWLSSLSSISPSSSSSASPIKALLLDDGWQDTSTFTDFSDSDRTGQHAERRALKSFGVKKGWYDIGGTTAAPSAMASGVATPVRGREGGEGVGADEQQKFGHAHRRGDSGYGRSPEISLSSANFEEVEMAREGVSAELCDAVMRIKETGVEKVGVWMTLLGYWHGIHPDGALGDAYDLRLTTFKSTAHPDYSYKLYIPSAADLPAYYHDYFSGIKAAGVDFVKVDDQAVIDSIVSQEVPEDSDDLPADPGELKHLLLSSMRQAALDVFGSPTAVVHCMAGSPRIWGGELGIVGTATKSGEGARSIVRNSDDFFPDVPTSHRWHIQHNSLGTVLSSALRFEPDFDMAQEKGDFAEAHLASRAMSAAPLWSTDAGEEEEGKVMGGEEGWESLLVTTKNGPRVLQAHPGTVGSVLEGRLNEDTVARFRPSSASSDGSASPALFVGLALPAAGGAYLTLFNVLPEGETARTVVDTKDVGDALASLVNTSKDNSSTVVFSESQGGMVFAKEFRDSDLQASRSLPRALAEPVNTVEGEHAKRRLVNTVSLTLTSQ